MNYVPVSYQQKLKQLSQRSPWIVGFEVKPAPGHVDLSVRFLDLCEMAMRTTSPAFLEFSVKCKRDEMEIIAIPSDNIIYDADALQSAIELTLNESKIVCQNCGNYPSIGETINLWGAYKCCATSGNLMLWGTIPDIMAMSSEDRAMLFEKVVTEKIIVPRAGIEYKENTRP